MMRYFGNLVTRYRIRATLGRTTSVTDSPSNFFSMLKSGTWGIKFESLKHPDQKSGLWSTQKSKLEFLDHLIITNPLNKYIILLSEEKKAFSETNI